MSIDLDEISVRAAASAVARGRLSPLELTEHALTRIAAENPRLNAILTTTAESARRDAARLGKRIERGGRAGALAGVPITVKDLILTREAPTTLGSRVIPEGLPAGRDAAVVARLRRAGAIVVGKANLHEVALGVTTVNEHFGPARNPWDRRRVAGGSSGGSAVAVATGMGMGSVGSDTRGSIRIPAACCGVVGFKPTFGLVPTEGVFPLAASLDHVGPLARTVEDAAVLFAAMAGGAWPKRVAAGLRKPPRRFTIGIVDFFFRDVDAAVATAVFGAVQALEKGGATVVSVEIPELEDALEASRVIVLAEAISYHDLLLRQNRRGYGPMVRARLEGGYKLSALDLVRAEERRLELLAAYGEVFRHVDCLIAPTLPGQVPAIGAKTVRLAGRRVPIAEAFCRLNAPQNMTGMPAVSLPCGIRDGMPVGLQIVGPAGHDARVLGMGRRLEMLIPDIGRPRQKA